MARLSADEIDILRWRTRLLRKEISRVCVPKLPRPEVVIDTDSATPTRIVASLVIDAPVFDAKGGSRNIWGETSDPKWESTFIITAYIYGLEMLAILATIFLEGGFLRWKNVTFYIDNSNCRDALVRGYTETKIIDRTVKLFWPQVGKLGISVWSELVPSGFNPADAPTRAAPLPFPVRRQSKFGILTDLRLWVESEELNEDQAHPTQDNSHV